MRPLARIAIAGTVALAALGAWHQLGRPGMTAERQVEILDPAKVVLIRTPGGLLQVSEMQKLEEFGWKTSWDCPLIDCTGLPSTVSRIRVKARYVYRVPLAAEWRLEPQGSHYRLTVPALRLQMPVGFDTASAEIVTTESSVFSPAVQPNRDSVLRHLGPELAQRGASAAYIDAQQKNAEQTAGEFARKWMLDQGKKIERPIKVVFDGPNPL